MKTKILVLVAAISACEFAMCETFTWNGSAGDGLWSTMANWSTNSLPATALPGKGDTAVINNSAVYPNVATPAIVGAIRMASAQGQNPTLYVSSDLTATNNLYLGNSGTDTGGRVVVSSGIFTTPLFRLDSARAGFPANACDLQQVGGVLDFGHYRNDRHGAFRQSGGTASFGGAQFGEGSAGDGTSGGFYLTGAQSSTIVRGSISYRGHRDIEITDGASLVVGNSISWNGRADYCQLNVTLVDASLTVGTNMTLTSGYTGVVFAQTNGTLRIGGSLIMESKDTSLVFSLCNPDIVVNNSLTASQYAKNFNALQQGGSFVIMTNAFVGVNEFGRATTLEQMRYRLQGGNFTVGAAMYVGYTGAGAFYQEGGSVSITNNLIIGFARNDRIDITTAPALYRIESDGILNVGGTMQVGGSVDKQNIADARFEVVGGCSIEIGALSVRKTSAATPRQTGTLAFHIEKDGVFNPIHVERNVLFDAGTRVHLEAQKGGIPGGAYTLLTWDGTLTNNGVELDSETDTEVWRRFKIDPVAKTMTVWHCQQGSAIFVR